MNNVLEKNNRLEFTMNGKMANDNRLKFTIK